MRERERECVCVCVCGQSQLPQCWENRAAHVTGLEPHSTHFTRDCPQLVDPVNCNWNHMHMRTHTHTHRHADRLTHIPADIGVRNFATGAGHQPRTIGVCHVTLLLARARSRTHTCTHAHIHTHITYTYTHMHVHTRTLSNSIYD